MCGELKSRKHLMMASGTEVVSAGVAYVSLIKKNVDTVGVGTRFSAPGILPFFLGITDFGACFFLN